MSKTLRNNFALAAVAILGIALVAVLVGITTAVIANAATYNFTQNLKMGMSGSDVMQLQQMLNMSADTQVSASGAGSPGSETSYFGSLTKAAVIKWQEKNAAAVLTPVGLSTGTGYFGPSSRAFANGVATTGGTVSTVSGCTSTVGYSPTTGQKCDSGVSTVPTTGGALSVAAASQPGNGLFVQNAARAPFTRVTFTAGANDVTVSGITVERVGAAVDSVIAGIVLLDENGIQLGIAKTLNSNHQTTVGDPFVVKAGTSRTMTIAGNAAAALTNYAGQVVALQVNAVNTSGTVSGSLPIVGAYHTVNASLTIGTAQMAISSYDPSTAQTGVSIGTTNYRFAGVRITAGSSEQTRVKSIRWNQTGSAGSGDLVNVMTYVDGTAYPTTVSSDGKYYTAVFGSGIVIDKGLSKDFYVQGDIVGTSAASRTIEMDIYKATDVNVTGETYGYGITPTAPTTATANTNSQFTTGTPFYSASVITASAGSATSIQKSISVAAQNIAVNVPNQVLGGFDVDFKGEPISVASLPITIATTTWGTGTQLTNVSIYGPNGNVVAGPKDGDNSLTSGQTYTFTDTITFPIGKGTYTIKGKIPSGVSNGATVIVSTTPSSWSSITGQTTGNTIAFTTGNFAMNTMTVRAASLEVTLSASPAASTIVSGSQGVTMANYVFDASQSGEDVRFSSVALTITGTAANLTTCQIWDGAAALNTGSNVIATANPMTFTFDSSLTVAKGTVKTLALKCNIVSTGTGTHLWGITTTATNPTVTGVTSSASVTPTVGSTGAVGTVTGQTLTLSTTGGTLVASQHATSPTYAVVAAGSTGNIVGVVNLKSTNENINLTKLGLLLTGNLGDVGNVNVYDGSTLVGNATFTGNNGNATSTFATPVVIVNGVDKQLTLKADFGVIGFNQPGTPGRLVKVDFASAEGTGVSSGLTINGTGSTGFAGSRLQKTYPVITYSTVSGVAQNGSNDLLVVNVAANTSGDVTMNKLTFTLSTTTVATLTAAGGFTFTGPNGNVGSSTPKLSNTTAAAPDIYVYFDSNSNTNDRTIGAGTSKSYTLRYTNLSLTGTNTTGSVSVGLKADTAYPTFPGSYLMGSTSVAVSPISDLMASSIIWSPNSTSTATTTLEDWTNGYGLGGCFALSGLGQNCTARTIAK